MSEEDRREFIGARLDAKIAQAANKKVPYACPDLDQDYSLDEHYLTASEQKVMKRALQRSTKLVDNVSSNPYHPFQTNFKGQVPWSGNYAATTITMRLWTNTLCQKVIGRC